MEDQAPYTPAGGPRNLAAPLAAWLRTQGWVAVELALPCLHTLSATWHSAQQERFELTYIWQPTPHAEATCRLRVLSYRQLPELLFASQHVRRLREARALVGNCVRYANARLVAQLASSTAAS